MRIFRNYLPLFYHNFAFPDNKTPKYLQKLQKRSRYFLQDVRVFCHDSFRFIRFLPWQQTASATQNVVEIGAAFSAPPGFSPQKKASGKPEAFGGCRLFRKDGNACKTGL